jgi:hypothetical protein
MQPKITFDSINLPFEGLVTFGGVMAIATVIVGIIVHIAFAAAVYSDATHMNADDGRKTYFVGELIWSLWVLVAGPFGAGLYWALHHSTLRTT